MNILSILKIEENSIEDLSKKLNKTPEEITSHILKLENEGIIELNPDNIIKKFNYDKLTIEIG